MDFGKEMNSTWDVIQYQMVLVSTTQTVIMGMVFSLHENVENLYSLIKHSYHISFLLLEFWWSLILIHSCLLIRSFLQFLIDHLSLALYYIQNISFLHCFSVDWIFQKCNYHVKWGKIPLCFVQNCSQFEKNQFVDDNGPYGT